MERAPIEAALDRIRPFLHRDGGDIEVIGIAGQRVRVRLVGRCAGSPSAAMTMCAGVESYLREQVPELDGLDLD